MQHSLSKAAIITVICAVFAGCATTSDLDAVKAELANVKATADQANMQSAQALEAANTANAKIDRAFKKAAQK